MPLDMQWLGWGGAHHGKPRGLEHYYSSARIALLGKELLPNGGTFRGRLLLLKWTSAPSQPNQSFQAHWQDHIVLQQCYDFIPPSSMGAEEQFQREPFGEEGTPF